MTAARPPLDRRGLTLIELVVTLTILALAGALLSGAFAAGLRAWKDGVRSGREELVARIVLERIAAQLRAAVSAPAVKDNQDAVAFDAGEHHLRFVTVAVAGAAPVQVFYGLTEGSDGRHLVYREYPWPDKKFFESGRQRLEEEVEEVTGLTVSVIPRSVLGTSPAPALDEWSPLDGVTPATVTVEIEVGTEGGPEPRSYAITVPVLVE